ncbi:hypothetical protein LXA43DRAFT_756296, partial [Ganoderma leucocontextum]
MSPLNHDDEQPILAPPSKYRTLSDLPPELLHAIISCVKSNRKALRASSLVCRSVRAVAVEYFFPIGVAVTNVTSMDDLVSFLQHANPTLGNNIRWLRLSGKKGDRELPLTTVDAAVMARLLPLVPNLTSLHLTHFIYTLPLQPLSPSVSHAQEDTPTGPFHLRSLTVGSGLYATRHHKSSVSGLFRILSLFSVDTLDPWRCAGEFDTSAPLDPAALHRPLRIAKLDRIEEDWDSDCAVFLVKAFKEGIEPGVLESLGATCCSTAMVAAFGELLAHGGASLTRLDVSGRPVWSSDRRCHVKDPLDSHWHALNLASCPKLESIAISIYLGRASYDNPQSADFESDVPALSLAGVGMLSQAPCTLHRVIISLLDLPNVETLYDRRILRLEEFDKAITPSRFPVLKEVILEVSLDSDVAKHWDHDGFGWDDILTGVRRALPSLHTRGLLNFDSGAAKRST